jgi:hypothetical protein
MAGLLRGQPVDQPAPTLGLRSALDLLGELGVAGGLGPACGGVAGGDELLRRERVEPVSRLVPGSPAIVPLLLARHRRGVPASGSRASSPSYATSTGTERALLLG